ncbi:hypothetical protein OL548_28065 [Lysinibacillus sp. MHQ-1]|nr:hypothetical protein OL548_28065 [Lysinibacillus sp. MHQ-1]
MMSLFLKALLRFERKFSLHLKVVIFFTGTSASVDLAPPITDPFPFGQIAFASANIPPVPVTVDDRLLMVFYISSATDTFGIADILGKASAAINIV